MQLKKANNIKEWLDQRMATDSMVKVLLTEYFVPKKINFLWSFGMILATLFAMLLATGIFLQMYYKPDTAAAFNSVNVTIMQDVAYGWLFRNVHAVSASVFFLILFIHMFTGIYYGSFKKGREMIWITGMLLFGIFSAEAFSGYMLPWGQMSYWAAQVITNLFGQIPFIGDSLVVWIRGDYVVSDVTLTRFFTLHVVALPLVLLLLVGLHFYALRIPHVNNIDGEDIDFEAEAKTYLSGDEGKKASKIMPFWPGFISKDLHIIAIFFIFFFYLVFFHNGFAMDPINFIPADPMLTPPHIYPEWYFLWSYEVLRGFFFSSDLGLIAFGIANGIFFLMPWLDRDPRVIPTHKRPLFKYWFWFLIVDLVGLTIFGKLPPTGINAYIGFLFSISFLALFLILPYLTKKEAKMGIES